MKTEPAADVGGIPKINLNRREAATALGISPRKLDEMVANRNSGIPHLRLGRKVLFPVTPLQAWAESLIGKKVI
jgi:excisionase family DNA binding protein